MSLDELTANKLARLNAILGPDQALGDLGGLSALPVTRKDALLRAQADQPPFGGPQPRNLSHIFQSPGPIYEPGLAGGDFWRFGRFLAAIGVGAGDIVQNTFAYHFTPAGAMFEAAARAQGAVIFPAGPGQSAQQAEVAARIGTTVYAGTPDFLLRILEQGDAAGLDLGTLKTAAVSAGPLFPQLRQAYADRGITCRQCYGTADVGLIAYETLEETAMMVVDEDIILEIVTPGTGEPLPDGEIGEVVITVLNPDYPLIRFSVGDMSAIATENPGLGPRIIGWRGRADQAAKVRGMFIRPEQVSALVARSEAIARARVEVRFDGKGDQIAVLLETTGGAPDDFAPLVQETLKLRAEVTCVAPGTLPRDGVLIADLREVTAG